MRKRAKFNLSNFHNCTLKMGQLYPVHLQEVLPGDTIQMSQSIFMRLAPMVAPVMHPVYMFCHTFYVPSRVIANWMNSPSEYEAISSYKKFSFDFESFITGGPDGNDSQIFPLCEILKSDLSSAPAGTSFLADAFGIPIQNLSDTSFRVNALPFLAYYLIWNEYYRDQDLQHPFYAGFNKGLWSVCRLVSEGEAQFYTYFPLLQPCWSKDYFTTARPWPQKGPEVTIPVQAAGGGFTGDVSLSVTGQPTFKANGGLSTPGPNGFPVFLDSSNDSAMRGPLQAQYSEGEGDVTATLSWDNPGLSAAFTSTTPSGIGSINLTDFREAMALQRFEEHRSLFGSRYEDYLRYLGVRPQDSRLQMPEYLGGFTSPVQFSEVLQTSAGENGGVGDLYGHGISAARGRRIRRFIPEHGYIMSLMCVRPIPVYAQGLERLWIKRTKEDFWQRELEHVGQQEVYNCEVYADGTSRDASIFGYQNRYDEYRRGVNVVTGEFRTNQDSWTMARIFDNRPALNADFVECNPTDRIFQVGKQNSDQLYCMVKNNVIAKRLVSKNGNPI
nr:major head protein [Cressdnaviricota sp.]